MYVCMCKAITDKQIIDAVDNGLQNFDEIQNDLGVGTNCGACREYAQELVSERLADQLAYPAKS